MNHFASVVPIPKLSKNWNLWYRSVELTMMSLKIWKYCTGTLAVNPDELAESGRAMAIILGTLTEEDANLVMSSHNPEEMLDLLRRKYEGSKSASIMALKGDFHTIKFDDQLSFFGKIRDINSKLKALGSELDEVDMCQRVLAILPPEHQDIVGQVRVMSEFNMDHGDIDLKLVKIESLLRQRIKDRDSGISIAKHSNDALNKSVTLTTTTNDKKKNIKCHYCNRLGHIKKKCYKFINEKKNGNNNNNNNGNSNNNNNNDGNTRSKFVTGNAVLTIAKESDMMITDRFYADSGASSHVVNKREWLINFRSCNESFKTAGGQIKIVGYGDLDCQLHTGSVWHDVLIRNVALANQNFNLISIGQLERSNENLLVTFSSGKISIIKSGKCFLTGYRSSELNNLYYLPIRVKSSNSTSSTNVSLLSSSSVDLALLHERFCHVNKNTIIRMAKSKIVDGLSTICSDNVGFCNACSDGKITDVPHRSTEKLSYAKSGESIHIDIAGYTDRSIHGNKYYLICVDEKTSYVKVEFLKNRGDFFNKFIKIVNQIKLETGNNVLCIRSDRGTEFSSNKFRDFVESNGITHQFACVGVSQQNGLAERHVRNINEHATSILVSSGLPKFLWDEAVNCTVYVLNRTMNYKNVVPYNEWFNKKANVNNLIVFGSYGKALNDDKVGKFESKATDVYMVGYQGDHIYRCYLPNKREVHLISAVKFDEIAKCRSVAYEIPGDNFVSEPSTSLVAEKNDDDQDEDASGDGDDDVPRRGRPLGSQNKTYEVNQERLNSLRPRNVIGVVAAGTEPLTFDDAVDSEESMKWFQAMTSEMNSLIENKTFTLVDPPNNNPVITSKWIYRIKSDGRYKARLVARGFQQQHNVDYFDTYAPVISFDVVRWFFSIVASYDMELLQFDFTTAFLNGLLKEDIFMYQPCGYDDGSGRVWKLNRGLYGLKQAPRAWNERFHSAITEFGFVNCALDNCLYFKRIENRLILLILYVDDGFVASINKVDLLTVYGFLKSKFKINIVNDCTFLGIKYVRNRTEKIIYLDQSKYIKQKLDQFGLSNCKSVPSPIVSGSLNETFSDVIENYPYRQAVGSLLYVAVKTRPDILFAVSYCSKFLEKPNSTTIKIVKRIFRYLKGTIDYKLKFGGSSSLSFRAYSDADLGGDRENRKSTTGYLVWLNGPIIWKSKQQRCVVDNTCESEFIAAAQCCKDVKFVKNICSIVNIEINVPTLFIDNQSTVATIVADCISSRLRHINLKYHLIRQMSQNEELTVEWIESSNQMADIFTKALSISSFKHFCKLIMFLGEC